MVLRGLSLFVASTSWLFNCVSASVTVYGAPSAQATPCIGAVPCDGGSFNAVLPNDTSVVNFQTSIPVQLYSGGMDGLSKSISGDYFGFSLELSVSNHLLGTDGNLINPVFLNLLSTVISRSQDLMVRIGGNSQEQSVLVSGGLSDGNMIEKGQTRDSRTGTPELLISPSLVYAMANISSMLPTIKWFLGVPFNDTQNPRTEIAELAQQMLGDKLVGLQLGNEPDLYHQNLLRDTDYNQDQYFTEWGSVLSVYENDSNIKNNSQFVAPSVCCGGNIGWTPEDVWNTGFLDSYGDHLAYISVQHYPLDNCNGSTHYNPQDFISSLYLNHTFTQTQNSAYINTTQIAANLGKPVLLFETNTASCGGFSGLSDSFLSALWAVDYSLNMACGNISNTLFHVGGQSNYYNPFTPPATNQSHVHQWTIGPTFYSSLVVAEFFGKSGQAQVVDLFLNGNSQYTPGYVAFESGTPQRVLLGNFITDPSGVSNYTAYISVGGNQTGQANATPGSVQVKYLLADSVSEKFNITWAGQTFGGPYESDGRLQGDETIYTYTCDQANNVCAVPVPAPALALVFLSSDALGESTPESTVTFATTTTATGPQNTATVDQAVLATSNGRGGVSWNALGSTSFGSSSDNSSSGVRAMLTHVLLSCGIAFLGAVFLSNWR
ncbi:glycoside hydrolase family 79 [Pyrrhoderma noxium]|uniref:Glycoside hydrolase family 79 n=1 Tax=Pyrrhoderma noxium TaxID=2282107 RepID=A0A286UFV0_9AGAM|nr:glycoside hydrolase family 79 [Pyrrhoderma noxium]